MLRSLRNIEQYSVKAKDGDLGRVVDFLFDDERWVVRYIVIKTGGFFRERKVLISPVFVREAGGANREFHVALTTAQINDSPGLDTLKPVSLQKDRGRYGYPYFWADESSPDFGSYADTPLSVPLSGPHAPSPETTEDDPHLRSMVEVCGYHVFGSDGEIGHVEDFIADDQYWQVHYLALDTSNWWLGKKVLIAPHWASTISWENRTIKVDLLRSTIKNGPEWAPGEGINRRYEARLYDYYGRPVYWASETYAQGESPGNSSHPRS